MGIFEGVVVFVIAWWLILLPILSAGTRSQDEAGEVAPGTERGAPVRAGFRIKLLAATGGAALVTALFWLAFHFGWFEALMVW